MNGKMLKKIVHPFKLAAAQTLLLQLRSQIPQRLLLRNSHAVIIQSVWMPTISDTSCLSNRANLCSFHSSLICKEQLYTPPSIFVRHKSRRTRQDSDSEDESESDSKIDDKLDEDDFEAPAQFKVLSIHAPSLRMDAVLSNALNISRHRLEELFLSSCLLLNGEKMTKKGVKLDEGDYVDVILEKIEDQIKVRRAKLLKISSKRTSTDKFNLKVRVWKAPFLLDFTRDRNQS